MWHIDDGTACMYPVTCDRNDHDWPGRIHGWRADGSHPKHAPKESDMTVRSEGEQAPHDDVPAAQPQWVHKDGSLCPSWEECDTYKHTSLDGNETIQRIKAKAEYLTCDHNKPWGAKCIECGRTDENEQRDGNVGELIDGRVDVYGDPIMGFTRHAQVWSGILGIEVQPWQVALCMLGYKLVRTGITPDYSDNSDDIEGYLDIFRQLMPDMVQARDTAEYLDGGGQGARA